MSKSTTTATTETPASPASLPPPTPEAFAKVEDRLETAEEEIRRLEIALNAAGAALANVESAWRDADFALDQLICKLWDVCPAMADGPEVGKVRRLLRELRDELNG
jgi:hypothetical protein